MSKFIVEKPGQIRLAGIMQESIVDGPGIRFAIFCQGCPHACPDCHNLETHDFNGGKDVTIDKIMDAIDKNPLLAGVTFSGGEPFCQPSAFLEIAKQVKERNLNIVAYSGYTYEELIKMASEDENILKLLEQIDFLIDGRFVKSKKDLTLKFRGSSNQRLIDMSETRKQGKIVLAKDY